MTNEQLGQSDVHRPPGGVGAFCALIVAGVVRRGWAYASWLTEVAAVKLTLDKRGTASPKRPETNGRAAVFGRAGFFLMGMACMALLQAWAPALSRLSSGG